MKKEQIDTGCYLSLNEYMGITKTLQSVSKGDTLSATYTIWKNMKMMTRPINERLLTRQPLPPDVEDPSIGDGDGGSSGSGGGSSYYDKVLIDSWVEYTSNKKVERLTRTAWGQGLPWNQRVTLKNDDIEHRPAGCVAVAGAQLLYFLHNKWGIPQYMYKSGGIKKWRADIDETNFSEQDTLWSVMAKEVSLYSLPVTYKFLNEYSYIYDIEEPRYLYPALLIAYVGNRINTIYREESSSAQTKDIGHALADIGISSNYSEYDEALVKQTLDDGLPVCVSAFRTKKDYKVYPFTIHRDYENGHAWLIDGYKDIQCAYRYKYAWVNAGTVIPDGIDSELDYKNCYQSTTTVPGEVQRTWNMNFGWADSYSDATYSMDDNIWQVIRYDNSGNEIEYNYRYKKRILHNFKLEE